MHEALRLQAARRWVIRRGAVVAQTQTTSELSRTGSSDHLA
jgi:hypothetical protein